MGGGGTLGAQAQIGGWRLLRGAGDEFVEGAWTGGYSGQRPF